MYTELPLIGESKYLDRFNLIRTSFCYDKEPGKPKVSYKNRHSSQLINPTRNLHDVVGYIYLFIGKKLHMAKVVLRKKVLVFVCWVEETPLDKPILNFFFHRGVLKARILYKEWWRYNPVTTVFLSVKRHPSDDPTVPTLAQEPDEVSYIGECN